MMHSFSSEIVDMNSNLWHFCFEVPNEISSQLIDGDNRRVICKINNSSALHVALMPGGPTGLYFINVNKEVRKKLGLSHGSKVQIELEKDNSKYGMPMPEELQEVFDQDELGNRIFHELTLGKQRSLIYIVGKLKSAEKRVEKAIIMVEYLKSVNGALDFKELNEAFKNNRFKQF